MYKIKNIGKTKTFVYNGIKPPKKNDIEWSIDYDNKNGVDLNVNMNSNGDKSHYHQYLTNSELEELLKMPVVNKSIHQRLLEDFNPYNNNNTNTNYNNKNLDLITYPRQEMQQYHKQQTHYPYTMHNDLINSDLYNQFPLILQEQQQGTRQTSRQRPKIIKIKIYTKKHKHKKHSDSRSSRSRSRSNSSRNSRKHSRTTTRSISRTKSS